MLTAAALIRRVALDPSQFNTDVVAPELDDAGQAAALATFVTNDVLPRVEGMVTVPFLKATGCDSVAEFVAEKLSKLSATKQAARLASGNNLWDAAATLAGNILMLDAIDSNSESYDKDADRLWARFKAAVQALTDWAGAVVQQMTGTGEPEQDGEVPTLASHSRRLTSPLAQFAGGRSEQSAAREPLCGGWN